MNGYDRMTCSQCGTVEEPASRMLFLGSDKGYRFYWGALPGDKAHCVPCAGEAFRKYAPWGGLSLAQEENRPTPGHVLTLPKQGQRSERTLSACLSLIRPAMLAYVEQAKQSVARFNGARTSGT